MRRGVLPFLTAILALLSVAPSAGARRHRIVTDDGFVVRLGPWRLSDPTLGRATAIFGPPSSISGGGDGCYVRWRSKRIRATFVNLGGQNACAPQYGRLQFFTVRSRAWRTIGGLRVGHTTNRLRRKYPNATLRRGVLELVYADFGYGVEDGLIPTVSAVPRGGRVAALTMYVGAAGE